MQTQTFNIALPTDLVKKVDEIAKKEYRSRSELIREALRIYLEDTKEWNEIYQLGEKVMEEMGIKGDDNINKILYEYRHGKKSH